MKRKYFNWKCQTSEKHVHFYVQHMEFGSGLQITQFNTMVIEATFSTLGNVNRRQEENEISFSIKL